LAVFIYWLLNVYLPSSREVSGYVSEISSGMYGLPKAFESLKMFFGQMLSYGFDTKLWIKHPVTFITGFMGFALVGGALFSRKKGFFKNINRVDLFFLLWFAGIFCILFPYNYRPIRYAYLLYPALGYLSARWIMSLFEPIKYWGKNKWAFKILLFLSASFISYHLLIAPHFDKRSQELMFRYIPYGLMGGAAILLISIAFDKLFSSMISKKIAKYLMHSTAVILSLFIIGHQIYMYFSNIREYQKTIHKASIDLGGILGKDAVIAGSYSSALTQDNEIKSVIKMFGVPVVEKDFFNKVPATHIAIESGGGEGSNEGRAIKDYPEIMRNAPIVASYFLRGFPISVYYIGGTNSNPDSKSYMPTEFERAAIIANQGLIDSALILYDEYEINNSVSLAGLIAKANIYMQKGDYGKARRELNQALEIDKGNYNLLLMLAEGCLQLKPPDIKGAIEAYSNAVYYGPKNQRLEERLKSLKKYLR